MAAAAALTEFEEGSWGRKYPAITAAWRRNWEQVIPFLAYPPEVRRMMYTTNAIESRIGRCGTRMAHGEGAVRFAIRRTVRDESLT